MLSHAEASSVTETQGHAITLCGISSFPLCNTAIVVEMWFAAACSTAQNVDWIHFII